jgi:hypothetical protein
MPFKQGRISYITSQPDGSVYCPDTVNIPRLFDDRLSYAKGAMVLHTLRWVIGDSAFYAGVRNYLEDASCAYGFAMTIDLQQHLEASSGQNLTWYFDDWIYGEGFPSYTITWSQDANNLATFTVNQSQSHASVPFYELPLPIKFKNATNDTIVRVQNNFAGETFSVQLPFAADSLIFDPEYWIISANNSVNNVAEITPDFSFDLYPNPAGDQLFLHAGNAYAGNATTKIYDVSGKLILEQNFIFSNSSPVQALNVSALAKGAYVITVETEAAIFRIKFVKAE